MNDYEKPAPQLMNFRFTGNGWEYFKIWIVNLLLTVVTLGVFSAWAKVRRERYFFSNTWMGDHSFEYLADPVAILKGRAIALGVLIAYSAVASFSPLLEPVLALGFLALVPWIVVKGLTFKMRNSAFRNVRFNFVGTYKEAAKAYVLWPLLIPFSLGILAPLTAHRQNRLVVSHSLYGTTLFTFEGRLKDFYWVYGIAALMVLGGGLLIAVLSQSDFAKAGTLIAAIPLALFVYAFVRSQITNLVFNHTELGGNHLQSLLEPKPLFWIYLTNALGIFATAGLFAPWAKVRLARYKASCTNFIALDSLDNFTTANFQEVGSAGEEMGEAFDIDLAI